MLSASGRAELAHREALNQAISLIPAITEVGAIFNTLLDGRCRKIITHIHVLHSMRCSSW